MDMSQRSAAQHCHIDTPFCTIHKSHVTWNFAVPVPQSKRDQALHTLFLMYSWSCLLTSRCLLAYVYRYSRKKATRRHACRSPCSGPALCNSYRPSGREISSGRITRVALGPAALGRPSWPTHTQSLIRNLSSHQGDNWLVARACFEISRKEHFFAQSFPFSFISLCRSLKNVDGRVLS